MKILVTGSSGFVGHALMQHLVQQGHEVRGLSRQARSETLLGDLMDPASITTALDRFQPEVIFNMAAETDLKGQAVKGYRANTEGVTNLLNAVAASPGVKRVVWASSQLVHQPGSQPKSDTDYDPVGGYGQSKAEGERRVRIADGAGREWVIVRSTTIWGPGMSPYYTGMFGLIRRGLYFHIGRRPLRKSYSYIENLTAQLASLATAPAEAVHGRTFYLADSDPIELRSWADGFADAFGRSIPTLPLPLAKALALAGDMASRLGLPAPLTTPRLKNMLTEYLYDTSAIEAVHGPTTISNAEGVRRTATWFLAKAPS